MLIFNMLNNIGQASLPQACPVCLHEPVSADDCRPNKALRTTIKVFLRKKGIEREAARKKELVDKATTSAASATSQADAQRLPDLATSIVGGETARDGDSNAREVSQAYRSVPVSDTSPIPQALPIKELTDIPNMSIEVSILFMLQHKGLLTTNSLSAKPKNQGYRIKV